MAIARAVTTSFGRRRARSRGRRRGRALALLLALVLVGVWAASLRVVASTPDPYGVGRLAVAQFHHEYPRGIPLSVRVANTNVGWIGVCEGIAYLDGTHLSQSILRPDGSLYVARAGVGHGLWIVDVEVVHGLALKQVTLGQLAAGPPPPWRQLLPFGPSHPLAGSLQ